MRDVRPFCRFRQRTGGERPVTCLRALVALSTFITLNASAVVRPVEPEGSSCDDGEGEHDMQVKKSFEICVL